MSLRLALLSRYLRLVERPALARLADYPAARARFEKQARSVFRTPPSVRVHHDAMGGVPTLVVRPPRPAQRAVVLYLHGGGYASGSAATHWKLAGAIANASGWAVALPDYRLAPEHPFPAGLDDCLAVTRTLRDRGYDRIVLAGDSAGGGLAFALLHRLIASRETLPVAMIGLCPWADLTPGDTRHAARAATEAVLPPERMGPVAAAYLAGTEATAPEASPVFGTFTGAPPSLIHVSDAEILEPDAHALAARLRGAGAEATLRTWTGAPHVWHLFHGWIPEADAAIADIGRFIRSATSAAP